MKYGTSGFTEAAPASTAEIRTHGPDGSCTVEQLLTGALVDTAGTAGDNVTASHITSDGVNYVTTLTLASVAATIGDNAALAGGALVFTFPDTGILVEAVYGSVGMTLTTGTPTTDTPEFGLGTTVASGANATLGAVAATAENIWGPFVADDVAGTAEVGATAPSLLIQVGGTRTVYFNYADTWADVDDTAATVSGTFKIHWKKLS